MDQFERTSTSSSLSDDLDVCWICLEAATASKPLQQVCKCPRKVHEACLARWQLHSAGKSEERLCRFCNSELQDWRPVMTQTTGSKLVTPYMRVSFNGRTHKVQVKPGVEGAKEFEYEIRRLLQLPDDQEFDVIFHCRAPGTGDKLQLQGLNAFDAAVHCASLSSKSTASQASSSRKQQKKVGILGKLMQRIICSPSSSSAA
eukprot:jgi/Chrzof1/12702/Cz07g04170.t1